VRRSAGGDVGPGAGRGAAGDRAWVVCGGVAAGVLGELVFRQGTLFLMHILVRSFPVLLLAFGAAPLPDALVPVPPLALEGVVTAALRGGLWGAVLAVVLRRRWAPAGAALRGPLRRPGADA